MILAPSHPNNDRQSKAQQLLVQSSEGADPALLAFFEALYRNAAPEDVTRYAPQELAALVRLVFACATQHQPGTTLVRLFDPAADPPALVTPGDRVRFVAER